MKKRLISLALLLCIFTSVFSVFSMASERGYNSVGNLEISFRSAGSTPRADSIHDEFNFAPSSGNDRSGVYDYYYRDSYFSSSAYKYNEHLSTMSLVMAMSAFPGGGSFFTDIYANFEDLMTDVGFDSFEANTETDLVTTPYTMGVALAKKTVVYESRPYTLVAIAFRGSGYGSEWTNNFVVGSSAESPEGHKGFLYARDRALEFVLDYLERNVSGDTKLWITGYSRGGAVSGLTGAWFNDNAAELSEMGINLARENIFTYTFEAPSSLIESEIADRNYDNIFNIVNPNDFITLMPFENWGFVRPGIDHVLPTFYREKAQQLNEVVAAINDRARYDSHNFTPYISSVGASQAEYLRNFYAMFASRISRDEYAEKLENIFSQIISKLLNSGDREASRLVSVFAENLLGDLGIDTSDSTLGVFTMLIKLLDGQEATLERLCDAVGKNLKEAGYIENFDAETRGAMYVFIKVMFGKDDGKSMIPYFITLLSNFRNYKDSQGESFSVNCIINSHTPEIILAALTLEDNYYVTSGGALTWSEGRSAKEDSVTVVVNDGKRIYSVVYAKGSTVTLSAYATGCVSFAGWYVDGACVTTDSDYTFVAKESVTVSTTSVIEHKAVTDWRVDKEAVGLSEGVVSRHCDVCGADFVQSVEAPISYSQLNCIVAASGGVLLVLTTVIVTLCVRRAKKKKRAKKAEPAASAAE